MLVAVFLLPSQPPVNQTLLAQRVFLCLCLLAVANHSASLSRVATKAERSGARGFLESQATGYVMTK